MSGVVDKTSKVQMNIEFQIFRHIFKASARAVLNTGKGQHSLVNYHAGNTKGGSMTVQLPSCLTGLDWSVLQRKTKIVSCRTADSKPVKQEVNGTVILPLLVFHVSCMEGTSKKVFTFLTLV
jgi:hypothetical protein